MAKILLPSLVAITLLGAACGAEDPASGACSPLNCTGCCSGTMCKLGLENEACGQHGQVCEPCPSNESCQSGVCQPGTSCPGCIDPSGNCVKGDQKTACGAKGGKCEICTGTQICSGTCKEVCSYETCPEGCCKDGECFKPSNEAHCGLKGVACDPCETDETCSLGACVKEDCTDCKGCCHAEKCQKGTANEACGKDGDECDPCDEGDLCAEGECKPAPEPCDKDTCAEGCCASANGPCILFPKQGETACGKTGDACSECPQPNECQLGTCVEDQPCFTFCTDGCCTLTGGCIIFNLQTPTQCGKDGKMCGDCADDLKCLKGECTTDPVWDVWALNAVIDDRMSDGSHWDLDWSDPDPYVSITVGFITKTTIEAPNTVYPNWSSGGKIWSWTQQELLTNGLAITVYDDDNLGGMNNVLGTCTFKPTTIPVGEHILATCGDHVTDLKLKFVQQ